MAAFNGARKRREERAYRKKAEGRKGTKMS
jgi:hypothetical protein